MAKRMAMTARADGIRQWGGLVEGTPSNARFRRAPHTSPGSIASAGRWLRRRDARLQGRRLREASLQSLRKTTSHRHWWCKAAAAASENRDADSAQADDELAVVLAGAESAFSVNCVAEGDNDNGAHLSFHLSWKPLSPHLECTPDGYCITLPRAHTAEI